MPCRRVRDRLTTAKLASRADDSSLLLHCFGPPHVFVTDKLRSYGAAMKVIGATNRTLAAGSTIGPRIRTCRFDDENVPCIRFRSMRTLQKFVAVHSSIHNHFNQERHRYSRENFKLNRAAAFAEWRQLGMA